MSYSISDPDLATYDAWKVFPPCELEDSYCSRKCPYDCESLVEDDDYDYDYDD